MDVNSSVIGRNINFKSALVEYLPKRSQCSQWHPIACRRKWRRTNFRLESTHGIVGCASEWPR